MAPDPSPSARVTPPERPRSNRLFEVLTLTAAFLPGISCTVPKEDTGTAVERPQIPPGKDLTVHKQCVPEVLVLCGRKALRGGGTVFFSNGSSSYVLSHYHLLKDAQAKQDGKEASVFIKPSGGRDWLRASVVASDPSNWLMLLEVKGCGDLPALPLNAEIREPRRGEAVSSIGFPRSAKPDQVVSEGEVRYFGERRFYISCPGEFGFSGGPVLSRESGEFLGMFQGMYTPKGGSTERLCQVVSAAPIKDFWEQAKKQLGF